MYVLCPELCLPHIHMLNEYEATPTAMVSGDGAFERELGLDDIMSRGHHDAICALPTGDMGELVRTSGQAAV